MSKNAQMHRASVSVLRGNNGGLIIRIPKVSARDLLYDFNAWRQLLDRTDLDKWLLGQMDMEVSEIQVLADNGMGGNGPCPFHGYQHLQIFPLDKEPMTCSEAAKKMEG